MAIRRNMRGVTITLTTLNTQYNLYTLLAAIQTDCPSLVETITLQSDPGNLAANIWIGDITLSTTNRAITLSAGDTDTTSTYPVNGVDVRSFNLMSDTNSVTVNVKLFEAF